MLGLKTQILIIFTYLRQIVSRYLAIPPQWKLENQKNSERTDRHA